MADDYQITLKGKIKILYQLGKWHDVIKLSEQYNEKYGKDVEVDMMRFKCERRLNKTAPAEENKARMTTPESQAQESPESVATPETVDKEEPPLLLTADHDAVENPAMLIINEPAFEEQPRLVEDKLVDEPFELIISDSFAENEPEFGRVKSEPPHAANGLIIAQPFAEDKPVFSQASVEPPQAVNGLIITEPFVETEPVFSQASVEPPQAVNGLIITDPFAENEPVFNLAHNEPPVILNASDEEENAPLRIEPQMEEMAIVEENLSELVNDKIPFDFKSNAVTAFDTEPTLSAPRPQDESSAKQIMAEEKLLPAEPFTEMGDEKPQILS